MSPEKEAPANVQNIPICRFGGHTTKEGNTARNISITSCISSTDGIKIPPAFPLIWPRAWNVRMLRPRPEGQKWSVHNQVLGINDVGEHWM